MKNDLAMFIATGLMTDFLSALLLLLGYCYDNYYTVNSISVKIITVAAKSSK